MTQPVLASAISSLPNQYGFTLRIGDNFVKPESWPESGSAYWFVVISLQNLDVVANEVSQDASAVPSAIGKYEGQTGYFVFVLTFNATAGFVPTGALAAFLFSIGAARGLRRLEQLVEQLGTGTIVRFAYCLGATTDDGDLPGAEAMSINNRTYLTLMFRPIEDADGKSLGYAPSQV